MIDIGSVVNGKYRLVRLLGDGGMGAVYEAQHTVLGTRVAIKVLHPELNRRTGLVERFLQEARVSAQIRSPHVVQVTDVDRMPDGHAYIVMELLEGEVLSTVLDRQRKLPVPVACEYTIQILQALEAAHALGVIHRDLKPENVFVTFAGGKPVLKLIDFGIAKARRTEVQKNLTVAGVVMGTAEYMAPEQAYSADKVDARADLYAVGVMLYEAISGARPVAGEDARIIALKVERGEVIPLVQVAPDTPREIAGLVHRAMAARPALRFANAAEMRLALQTAVGARRPTNNSSAGPAPRAGASATEILSPASAAAATAGSRSGPNASDPEPHVDTIRAPPIATALTPSPYVGTPMPATPPPPDGTRRRRSRGPMIALIALPVLIGAGLVALVVGTGTWASSASAPGAQADPTPAAVNLAPSPPAATAGTAASEGPSKGAVVPTLAPTRAVPARPGTSARPGGPAPVAAGIDAGLPTMSLPPGFPSSLPPFPTALPSGLAIPSGFPTSLPSGFPSVLPAWPPPMTAGQPPAPAHTANSSDPSY